MDTIYLIDDQPIANFITKKLLELEGYKGCIKSFTDPVKAFEALKEVENSLIFLDLNMPVMDGWQFLEKFSSEELKHKVIVLTSSTSKFDRDRAKEYEAVVRYMEKPLTKAKFAKIADLLNVNC